MVVLYVKKHLKTSMNHASYDSQPPLDVLINPLFTFLIHYL